MIHDQQRDRQGYHRVRLSSLADDFEEVLVVREAVRHGERPPGTQRSARSGPPCQRCGVGMRADSKSEVCYACRLVCPHCGRPKAVRSLTCVDCRRPVVLEVEA